MANNDAFRDELGSPGAHEAVPKTWYAQQEILRQAALGGNRDEVLNQIVEIAEGQAEDEMLASILLLSDDGRHLHIGGAPSLPDAYNNAIHGMAIGEGEGSCGTAAATGKPVFVEDISSDPLWSDFRDLARAHGLAACWSVPIMSGAGKVIGTFANYYREPRQPTQQDKESIEAVALTASIAVERFRLEAERDRAEAAKKVVLEELQHRVKNAYSLAQSLVSLNARSASSAQDLAERVSDKLRAISASQDLIVVQEPGAARAESTNLKRVLETILAPLGFDEQTDRIRLVGLDVPIAPAWLSGLAMVFHELATNSIKYGALSEVGGKVRVDWDTEEDELCITWIESGGPEAVAPESTGFGSRLVVATIRQLGGSIKYDWRAEGLKVHTRLPLET